MLELVWSPGHHRLFDRLSKTTFQPVGWRQSDRAADLFAAGHLLRQRYAWKVKSNGRRIEFDWKYKRRP